MFRKKSDLINTLFRGENYELLKLIPSNSIDLIYIDPPFFTQKDHKRSIDKIKGVNSKKSSKERKGYSDKKSFFESSINSEKTGIYAYCEWMRIRINELHRILKPTGSIVCHIDYHASHYIKILLDEIFGYKNFRNEIIWQRKQGSNSTKAPTSLSNNTDSIYFYSKSENYTFNPQYKPYAQEYIEKNYRYIDENGERYTSENMRAPSYSPTLVYNYKGYEPHNNGWCVTKEKMKQLDKDGLILFPKKKTGRLRRKNYLKDRKGVPLTNLWTDISCVQGSSLENTGWPTQKPEELLERIIKMFSNKNEIVLDCFSGCGTTIFTAEQLKRKWIGVELSETAVKATVNRFSEINHKVNVKVVSKIQTLKQKNISSHYTAA